MEIDKEKVIIMNDCWQRENFQSHVSDFGGKNNRTTFTDFHSINQFPKTTRQRLKMLNFAIFTFRILHFLNVISNVSLAGSLLHLIAGVSTMRFNFAAV